MKIVLKYHSLKMLRTLRLSEFIDDVQKYTGKSVELCLVEMNLDEKRSAEAPAQVGKGEITRIKRRAIVYVEGQRHQQFDEMLNRLP